MRTRTTSQPESENGESTREVVPSLDGLALPGNLPDHEELKAVWERPDGLPERNAEVKVRDDYIDLAHFPAKTECRDEAVSDSQEMTMDQRIQDEEMVREVPKTELQPVHKPVEAVMTHLDETVVEELSTTTQALGGGHDALGRHGGRILADDHPGA